MIDSFKEISMRGRYIYGYLCLNAALKKERKLPMPGILTSTLEEFVSVSLIETWEWNIVKIIPWNLLDKREGCDYPDDIINELVEYYHQLPSYCIELLELLYNLGMSNTCHQFVSEWSLEVLSDLIDKLNENQVPLPGIEIIKGCSVKQRDGMGNLTDMKSFI